MTIVYVSEGDSLSVTGAGGFGGTAYCNTYAASHAIKTISYTSKAVGGSNISIMTARASGVDALIVPGALNILSVLLGTNDQVGAPDNFSSFLTALASYWDARRTAGWNKLVGINIPPRSVGSGGNANARATSRSTFTTWLGTGRIDALVDLTSDPTWGPDAAAENVSLYSDGVHPSQTGEDVWETILRPVMNRLLNAYGPTPISFKWTA